MQRLGGDMTGQLVEASRTGELSASAQSLVAQFQIAQTAFVAAAASLGTCGQDGTTCISKDATTGFMYVARLLLRTAGKWAVSGLQTS